MYICIVAIILPLLTAYGFKIPIGGVPSKSKPHNFKILGKDIAIWWNKEQWSAVDDMCLHRQASLSKGIISKTGDLKCGYHGWEYNDSNDSKVSILLMHMLMLLMMLMLISTLILCQC